MEVGDILIELSKDVNDAIIRSQAIEILAISKYGKATTCYHHHMVSDIKVYQLEFLKKNYKVVTYQIKEIEANNT